MKLLFLIGAIVVVVVIAAGTYYLITNLEIKKDEKNDN